jgi:hypothetical protein
MQALVCSLGGGLRRGAGRGGTGGSEEEEVVGEASMLEKTPPLPSSPRPEALRPSRTHPTRGMGLHPLVAWMHAAGVSLARSHQ